MDRKLKYMEKEKNKEEERECKSMHATDCSIITERE